MFITAIANLNWLFILYPEDALTSYAKYFDGTLTVAMTNHNYYISFLYLQLLSLLLLLIIHLSLSLIIVITNGMAKCLLNVCSPLYTIQKIM